MTDTPQTTAFTPEELAELLEMCDGYAQAIVRTPAEEAWREGHQP